jgi:Fur family transcriptional regulator, ferric uptake regulator
MSIYQELGLRPTRTRELLFRFLEKAKKPLSVPEILSLSTKEGSSVNKTTLYRELERLTLLGGLQKVQLSAERVSYELATHHHHHFVCEGCQSVQKVIFSETVFQAVERALQKTGNHVTRHTLEFFGVCSGCNK